MTQGDGLASVGIERLCGMISARLLAQAVIKFSASLHSYLVHENVN